MLIRRPFRFVQWNATLILVLVNVLFFVASQLFEGLYVYLALSPPGIEQLWLWQFASYMFMHGDISHILFNMLALYIFGEAIEKNLGSKEFLLFYFVTGTLAGVLSWLIYLAGGMYYVILVGASGAVYAVMLAFAVLYPWARIFVFGLVPVPAPVLILIYTGYELFSQLTGIGGNVAHMTHLGGYLFALAYFPVRFGVDPIKRLTRSR